LAYEAVNQAEAECGPFEVREIDISLQPDAVREYGVLTTPSLVINGHLEFSGVPKVKKLIKRLKRIQQHTS
jgi:Thioredoxin domain